MAQGETPVSYTHLDVYKRQVYHFSIGTLLFIFVAVLLLLNMKQLMRTDWEHLDVYKRQLYRTKLFYFNSRH